MRLAETPPWGELAFVLMITMLWTVPPLIIVLNGKWDSIGSTAIQVNPTIVNGLLTLSGIIFAFHLGFFKPSTKRHITLTLIEVAFLGLVGAEIFLDFSLFGYISSRTLWTAYVSLTYNLGSITMEIADQWRARLL
jgi:hypothetical protein